MVGGNSHAHVILLVCGQRLTVPLPCGRPAAEPARAEPARLGIDTIAIAQATEHFHLLPPVTIQSTRRARLSIGYCRIPWSIRTNAYDFSILGNTPINLPICLNNSNIPGFAIRASVPNSIGFTALV